MQGVRVKLAAVAAVAAALSAGGAAVAHDGGERSHGAAFRAFLTGYEEVPAVSTPASGTFRAFLGRDRDQVFWELTYRDLEGAVQQAHIHFGQRAVNGGVSVFLCSNLATAPAGTQACPAPPARITGTFGPDEVVGPAAQGIEPGEFDELIAAMQAGITYANVHSSRFPEGEIRGQIWSRTR